MRLVSRYYLSSAVGTLTFTCSFPPPCRNHGSNFEQEKPAFEDDGLREEFYEMDEEKFAGMNESRSGVILEKL